MSNREKAHTADVADEMREAVQTIGVDLAKSTQHAGEALKKARQAFRSSAGHLAEDLGQESAQAVEGLKTQMRANPITYLAAAAGIGFALGFMARRN
jgi:ElaB/YqjD/DUF883 family membrane-anchored ribosome-binding protein